MTNEEINKLMAELEKLKTPEQDRIVIPECSWVIGIDGNIHQTNRTSTCIQYGYKRTTQRAAELAAKRMIRNNRLSLLAHILDVECEFVSGEDNYYVFQNADQMLWETNYSINLFYPDRVYMTKEGAESIAVILNNNEFSLELEDE